MKNQTLKKSIKKFEEREVVVNNKAGEGAISNKKREGIIKNNNYGITLIALVITVIVLLILARYLDQHAFTVITAYFQGQEKLK